MQLGAVSFTFVQVGTRWCTLVQVVVVSYKLVKFGTSWCSLVKGDGT